MLSKVERRGPIDPPPPLCLRVTFLDSCLLGGSEWGLEMSVVSIFFGHLSVVSIFSVVSKIAIDDK